MMTPNISRARRRRFIARQADCRQPRQRRRLRPAGSIYCHGLKCRKFIMMWEYTGIAMPRRIIADAELIIAIIHASLPQHIISFFYFLSFIIFFYQSPSWIFARLPLQRCPEMEEEDELIAITYRRCAPVATLLSGAMKICIERRNYGECAAAAAARRSSARSFGRRKVAFSRARRRPRQWDDEPSAFFLFAASRCALKSRRRLMPGRLRPNAILHI